MSPRAGRAIRREELPEVTLCRLSSRIVFSEHGCWVWTGARTPTGYGNVRLNGANYYAHRVVYALTWGETPAGAVLRHSCDNPSCVRPDHILAGTQADNQRDMALRDRCGNAKITNAQAREVGALYDAGVDSRVIAARFGIARSTVYNIARGVSRRHGTGRGKAPVSGPDNGGLKSRQETA